MNLLVTVKDMAEAREARAAKQLQLMKSHGTSLVCLSMNIAGPVKQNGLIRQAFGEGVQLLSDTLAGNHLDVIHKETHFEKTGPEAYFCARGNAERIKRLTIGIEDRNPFGRLLDIDVFEKNGAKVARPDIAQPSRLCLMCDHPSAVCARSRRHTAEELFAISMRIIREHFIKLFAEDTASLAVRALLTELAATPKPGLVDRVNNGAHKDMDFFTFLDSAATLAPYFQACAFLGSQAESPEACFPKLRAEGVLAEGRMMRVTQGVNTHKGAVFSLGILCAAAGYAFSKGLGVAPETLSAVSSQMTADALLRELDEIEQPRTFGETLMKGRLAGARAEAAQGFPTVLRTALFALDKALDSGDPVNDACCQALLAVMAEAEDSVLLKRAGQKRALEIQRTAVILLSQGCPKDGMEEFDRQCISGNVSAGGSADLLAAALFMRLIRQSRWLLESRNFEEQESMEDFHDHIS